MLSCRRLFIGLCVAASWVLTPTPATAQNHYTLEMVTPLPCDGAAEPNGTVTGARHCRAYPSLEYRHRASCVSGNYPYTYTLTGAPAWLSISATTGLLSGTPTNTTTDDDASITVTCTDASTATASRTFGIDVTTTGFVFVDKVNGLYRVGNGGCTSPCGTGTLANPYKDLEDLFDGTSSLTDIAYFRGCVGCGTGANSWTYTTDNITVNAPDAEFGDEEIEWTENGAHAAIFLNYPGETPRLDFAYTGDGCGDIENPTYDCGQSVPRLELGSGALYVAGMQFWRCMTACFEIYRSDGRGAVFNDNYFHSGGPGIEGGNSALLIWERSSDHMTYADTFIGNTVNLSGITCGSTYSAIKIYDVHKLVVADNTFTGEVVGSSCDALIALKGGPTRVTVRNNVLPGGAESVMIGGDQAHSDAPLFAQFSAEILYNLCLSPVISADFGRNCLIAIFRGPDDLDALYIYRNTFYGVVSAINFDAAGPVEWRDNVIINSEAGGNWAKIFESNIGSTTGWVYGTNAATADGNLLGVAADNIISPTTGQLQGSHLTNNGPASGNPKGFQLSAPTRRIPFSRRREP
jgi:hypothetical protein